MGTFQNPFRLLYHWAVQEALDIKALRDCFKSREKIEEDRKKLMNKIKMSEEGLNAMRPSTTGTVKELF